MKKWDIRNNSVGSKKEDQSFAAWLLRSSCAAKKVAWDNCQEPRPRLRRVRKGGTWFTGHTVLCSWKTIVLIYIQSSLAPKCHIIPSSCVLASKCTCGGKTLSFPNKQTLAIHQHYFPSLLPNAQPTSKFWHCHSCVHSLLVEEDLASSITASIKAFLVHSHLPQNKYWTVYLMAVLVSALSKQLKQIEIFTQAVKKHGQRWQSI